MESKIKYYYNLLVEKIVKKENFSLFVADNNLYILKKETNISPIFFIKNDFINVIKNKDGQYITNIENIEYFDMDMNTVLGYATLPAIEQKENEEYDNKKYNRKNI